MKSETTKLSKTIIKILLKYIKRQKGETQVTKRKICGSPFLGHLKLKSHGLGGGGVLDSPEVRVFCLS